MWLLLVALSVAAQFAIAVEPGKQIEQFVVDTWKNAEGLPNSAVEAIVQARDGYLWIGTQGGLARFDGYTFTVFDHKNVPALASDTIFALIEDESSSLWIGTQRGLVRRSPDGDFTPIDSIGGVMVGRVFKMAKQSGSVWIAAEGGVFRITGNDAAVVRPSRGGFSKSATSVVVDADGRAWAVAEGALLRYDDGHFDAVADFHAEHVTSVSTDRSKHLWVFTSTGTIYRQSNAAFEPWRPAALPALSRIVAFHEDGSGTIWLITEVNGIYRLDAKGNCLDSAFADLSLLSMIEDSESNIWLGTLGHGLMRLRDGAFTSFTTRDGLVADSAYSVIEDGRKRLWIGTLNGLTQLNEFGATTFTTQSGLSSNYVSSLCRDTGRGIWVGTSGLAIDHIGEDGIDRVITLHPPQSGRSILALMQTTDGTLWAGTSGAGLAREKNGEQRFFTTREGLPDDIVSAIAHDASGNIWVGTYKGAAYLVGDTIHPVNLPTPDGSTSAVLSMMVDDDSTVWIGTMHHALYLIDHETVFHIGWEQGLLDDSINGIVADDTGALWFGTDKGVMRVARTELAHAAADASYRMKTTTFGEADGMISSEASAGAQPPVWRASDGKLWFATTEGVAVVNPASSRSKLGTLIAHIETVRVDDRATKPAVSGFLMPADASRLEIAFSAANLDSSGIGFRYRMLGADPGWIDAGVQRTATYHRLKPGQHRFEVQARRRNEDWSAAASSIIVIVQPTFYETYWFFALTTTGVIALFWTLHSLRIRWLKMRTAVLDERHRIAGELHDSLAQGFSGINLQIEAALRRLTRAPEQAATHLQLARQTALSSLNDARRSVWNLASDAVDEDNVVSTVRAHCEQRTAARGARLHIIVVGKVWSVNAAVSHEIGRVAQEAVSNALEHGGVLSITIEFEFRPLVLTMTVIDAGRGFSANTTSGGENRGYGLSGVRRRCDAIGARLAIDSEKGNGTRVRLRISRPRALWRGSLNSALWKTL